jgi:hypothetical protein
MKDIDKTKWRKMAIAASLIAVIVVMAGAPLVIAFEGPVTVQGMVKYANGTHVPVGWTVTVWNLDKEMAGEPWTTTTGDPGAAPWDYMLMNPNADDTNTFSINVSNPEGTYKAETDFTAGPFDTKTVNLTVVGPPNVEVLYPNGGEEIPMGTTVEVSAHAEDDVGVTAVWFNYSCDNGSTWISIGVGVLQPGGTATDGMWNASWTPEIPGNCTWSECLVRADAVDGDGETATDTSDGTFSLVDKTKPMEINQSANPPTIVMDSGFTELQVDVADTYNDISKVTINLSPIGGDSAANMSNIGNYSQGGLTWTTYNYTTNSSVNGTFNLYVNATDVCGNSNTSVFIPLEVIAGVPPTNLTAEWNQTDDTVNVSWNGTPEASYDIYLATNKSGPFNKVDTVTGLFWIDEHATDDTLRLYQVSLSGTEPDSNMTAGKYTIPIYNGWNLISLPLLPHNTSLGAVICNDKAADDDKIYGDYPGSGLSWKSARYYGGTWYYYGLTTLEPGEGYYYNRAGGNFNLTIAGEVVINTSTTVYNGWNLLGYVSVGSSGLDIINDPVDDDKIYGDNPGSGLSWKSARYYGGTWYYYGLTTFNLGEGYYYNRAGGDFIWTYTDL